MLDTALVGVPIWLILLLVAGAAAAAMLLKPKEKKYTKEEYEAIFGKEDKGGKEKEVRSDEKVNEPKKQAPPAA